MRKNIIFTTLLLAAAFVSCSKISSDEYRIPEGTIGFSKPKIGTLATKSPVKDTVTVCSAEVDGCSLSVECREDYFFGDIATKGTVVTTSNLDRFAVDGFLGDEIDDMVGAADADKANHHFIDNGLVAKNGDHWSFEQTRKWRYGVNHYFWGYYPADLEMSYNTDYSEAEFTFTNEDFETDIITSNTERYYGKEEEAASTRVNSLSLDFYHALAAVEANTDGVQFKIKSGNTTAPAGEGRGSILGVELRNLTETSACTVEGGSSFTWSNPTGLTNDSDFADNGTRFYIPQSLSSSLVCLTIKDNIRELTRPYIFSANTLLGGGSWETGKKYGYNIKGSVVFPDVSGIDVPTGIEVNFSGKNYQNVNVIDEMDCQYVKTIKLSWTGLPTGNAGNGTFALLSLENAGYTPKQNDYLGNGQSVNTGNDHLIFAYDLKNSSVVKGSVNSGVCTAEFEIPAGWTSVCVWVSYIGANNSGTCNWSLRDFSMEVVEWR